MWPCYLLSSPSPSPPFSSSSLSPFSSLFISKIIPYTFTIVCWPHAVSFFRTHIQLNSWNFFLLLSIFLPYSSSWFYELQLLPKPNTYNFCPKKSTNLCLCLFNSCIRTVGSSPVLWFPGHCSVIVNILKPLSLIHCSVFPFYCVWIHWLILQHFC